MLDQLINSDFCEIVLIVKNKSVKNKNNQIRGIVVNSGNANALTGKKGYESIKKYVTFIAKKINCSVKNILVASTGVIGEPFPTQKVIKAIKEKKSPSKNWIDAARSIMTTDTYPKGISINTSIGKQKIKQKNETMNVNDKPPQAPVSTQLNPCLLYTSPSPRDLSTSRMPSSA